jgi:hypothetical protein
MASHRSGAAWTSSTGRPTGVGSYGWTFKALRVALAATARWTSVAVAAVKARSPWRDVPAKTWDVTRTVMRAGMAERMKTIPFEGASEVSGGSG